MDDVEDRAVSGVLFRLLDQFLAARGRRGGAAAIKADHQAWIERQDWHRPDGSP
jgi:hypothetical protein